MAAIIKTDQLWLDQTTSSAVGAPALIFGADSLSGLYRIGTNNIGLTINGTKLLDMSSATFAITGTLSATTGAAVGGATAGAGGLAFPATAVAVADANTLDDYEEGTWTPSLGGNTTYGSQVGTYTKIGRLVYVFCNLAVTTLGTGGQTIAGLPFTVSGGNETSTSVAWNSLAISSVYLVFYGNGTSIYHQHATAAAASLTDGASIFTSGTAVKFCLIYSI